MAYTVFESTNMAAPKWSKYRIYDVVAESNIENGTVGYIEVTSTSQSDTHVYNFTPGTKSGAVHVIANNPAYDPERADLGAHSESKYIIPAGTVFRAFELAPLDEFAISIDGVTSATQATMDVGKYVTVNSTTGKFVAAASSSDSALVEGYVIRKRKSGIGLTTVAGSTPTTLYTIKITKV